MLWPLLNKPQTTNKRNKEQSQVTSQLDHRISMQKNTQNTATLPEIPKDIWACFLWPQPFCMAMMHRPFNNLA